FQWIQKTDSHKEVEKSSPIPVSAVCTPVSPEMAAAVALALHLETTGRRPAAFLNLDPGISSSWARSGRLRMMNDRISIFHLNKK
ncbi:MAG: hypothetical protein AB1659_09170, partial [Thermodesulfobacteriota bacterium]